MATVQELTKQLDSRPGEPFQIVAPSRPANDYNADYATLKVKGAPAVDAIWGFFVFVVVDVVTARPNLP